MIDISGHEAIRSFISFFEEISRVPRVSGNTRDIAEYLVKFAKFHGFEYRRDEIDNVIIKKAATKGYEARPTVILQGHTDMVPAGTPEKIKELLERGVTILQDGDKVYADGTTLGGDNGIAVAIMLAILDSEDIPHPALECVFTSNEEIGLLGAKGLDCSYLSGRTMINLDAGGDGLFCVGCAGGICANLSQYVRRAEASGNCYKLTLSGFLGGHSGADIHLGHKNAIKVLAECLDNLGDIKLLSFEGGSADNAIPQSAEARFISERQLEELRAKALIIFEKYKEAEPSGSLTLCADESFGLPLDGDSTNKILSLICYEPTGIIAMSRDLEGLVETSLNIGTAHLEDEYFNLVISIRSSLEESKFAVLSEVDRIAWTHRATLTTSGDYPGWAYRKDSPIRDACCASYKELFGEEAKIKIIHAGLECGLFSSKIEGLDCISIGPNTFHVHTTAESFSISSTERFWRLLLRVLSRI